MKKKLFTRVLLLGLLSVSVSFASSERATESYALLSTVELQLMVEKLSATDELPFEMGVELMKRWSHTS